MEQSVVLGKKTSTCNICGKEVNDLKQHLIVDHQIDTWSYFNLNKERELDLKKTCQDCGSPRYLMSPGFPGLYLPCKKCTPVGEYQEYVMNKIKNIQKESRTNKFLQIILSNQNFLSYTIDYNIPGASELLKNSAGPKRILKDTYLGCYIKPGYPKEVSKRNQSGISVISVNIPVTKDLIVQLSDKQYKILLPEQCGYDMRHHSRYSIINSNQQAKGSRYTKRIRLEGDLCYKFWNNHDYPNIKSIFRIVNVTGESIPLENISGPDLLFLKQIILRNKTTSDILWKIYNEVVKYTKILSDEVLFRNTVEIFPTGKISSRFVWEPKEEFPEFINISIL